mgnify:CR=1 FL=1
MRVEYMHDILCPIVIQRRTERKKLEEQKKKDYERLEEIRIAQINTEKLKRRNRQLLIGLIVALLSIVATALFIWDGYFREIDTRYGIIIKTEWLVHRTRKTIQRRGILSSLPLYIKEERPVGKTCILDGSKKWL